MSYKVTQQMSQREEVGLHNMVEWGYMKRWGEWGGPWEWESGRYGEGVEWWT